MTGGVLVTKPSRNCKVAGVQRMQFGRFFITPEFELPLSMYKSYKSFILNIVTKSISLQLRFAEINGWSTTKNRFRWSSC